MQTYKFDFILKFLARIIVLLVVCIFDHLPVFSLHLKSYFFSDHHGFECPLRWNHWLSCVFSFDVRHFGLFCILVHTYLCMFLPLLWWFSSSPYSRGIFSILPWLLNSSGRNTPFSAKYTDHKIEMTLYDRIS